MIKQLSDFTIFNGELSKDRYKYLHIAGCDDALRDLFLYKVEQENYTNKAKLRELLGGKKIYTYVEELKGTVDWSKIMRIMRKPLLNYSTLGEKLGRARWANENSQRGRFAEDINRICSIFECANEWECESEEEILNVLKLEYWYNDNVQKIRNMPKLTRLFRIIFEGALDRYKVENTFEPMIAEVMDELGRKPKTYIMEISTDYLDILTCSVSDNFTSCFNIKKGSCNMASPNYLAIDRTTAIIKLYEATEENKKAMSNGHLDWTKAVARAFVSFDVDKQQRVVIGRLYPDNKILHYDSLKEIVLPLLKCDNVDSGQWVKDMLVNYGDNYTGYKDYIESWNVGFIGKMNSKRISVGDRGCVYFNPFKNEFNVSDRWRLCTDTMWHINENDRRELENEEMITPYNKDKEESEEPYAIFYEVGTGYRGYVVTEPSLDN